MANDNYSGRTRAKKPPPRNEAELSPAEVRKKVWGETGEGEDLALREATLGADGEIDDTTDLVEEETPDTARRISDPTIKSPRKN
jgi:hypothetical protein